MSFHYSWLPPTCPEVYQEDRKWAEERWNKLVGLGYKTVTVRASLVSWSSELHHVINVWSRGYRYDIGEFRIECLCDGHTFAEQLIDNVRALGEEILFSDE